MKKIKIGIVLVLVIMFIPFVSVSAAGGVNVSIGSLRIEKGRSATFTISASNAAGNVIVQSNNSSIASVNSSSCFFDTTLGQSSCTITVTGVSAGNTSISVILDDVGTFDNEELSGTKTVNIEVYEPAPPVQQTQPANNNPAPSVNTNNNSNSNNQSSNNKTEKKEETKKEEKQEEKKEEKTEIKEVKLDITKFDVVGYDLLFKENVYDYDLDILDNVSDLYIIVEGKDISVTGDKKVDIIGKKKIVVSIKNGDITKNYTINLNKIKRSDLIKKEDTSNSFTTFDKILLTTSIVFFGSTIALGLININFIKKYRKLNEEFLKNNNKKR